MNYCKKSDLLTSNLRLQAAIVSFLKINKNVLPCDNTLFLQRRVIFVLYNGKIWQYFDEVKQVWIFE